MTSQIQTDRTHGKVHEWVRVWAKIKAQGFGKEQAEKMVKETMNELYTELMDYNYRISDSFYMEISTTVARCITYKSVGLRVCLVKGFANHFDCHNHFNCHDRNSKQCVETWFRIIALKSVSQLPLYEVLRNFVAKGKRVCRGVFTMPIELRKEEVDAIIREIIKGIDLRTEHGDFTVNLDNVDVSRRDHVYGTINVEYDVNWYNIKFRDLRLRLYRVGGGFCSDNNDFLAECVWGNNFEVFCLEPA